MEVELRMATEKDELYRTYENCKPFYDLFSHMNPLPSSSLCRLTMKLRFYLTKTNLNVVVFFHR